MSIDESPLLSRIHTSEPRLAQVYVTCARKRATFGKNIVFFANSGRQSYTHKSADALAAAKGRAVARFDEWRDAARGTKGVGPQRAA